MADVQTLKTEAQNAEEKVAQAIEAVEEAFENHKNAVKALVDAQENPGGQPQQ